MGRGNPNWIKRKEERLAVDTTSTIKEEVVLPVDSNEPFITTDKLLAEKLQDKFSFKNISLNKDNETRTFTFNATRLEVEAYLGGK